MSGAKTVVVLGAGATKACGGPLTSEILPAGFRLPSVRERQVNLNLVDEFLVEHFHVPKSWDEREADDYPALPLLMSLVDVAIDRRHAFGSRWPIERLYDLRQSLELLIFAVIDHMLRRSRPDYQYKLLQRFADGAQEPCVITLNYDIIADNGLLELCAERHMDDVRFADYGCDITIPDTPDQAGPTRRFGRLLKLHGSLNWHYCPNCHRLELGVSDDGERTVKLLHRFLAQASKSKRLLRDKYQSPDQVGCLTCGASVRPVLISPSVQKDYRNPHISRIWFEAERCLREAESVLFVGYSMPDDDVHVVYLLKRALERVDPNSRPRITVVEKTQMARDDHPTWRRYRALFGERIEWCPTGLEGWLADERVAV